MVELKITFNPQSKSINLQGIPDDVILTVGLLETAKLMAFDHHKAKHGETDSSGGGGRIIPVAGGIPGIKAN